MRIVELNISEFGSLKNKVINPTEGMNIIYGENESGKSTVLLFIKYMLYGLGRKSAANSDRERSLSWSGHMAAGSMTFEHSGSLYRIERRYIDGTREKMSVIRLDDGVEIKDEKTPGEYFLGVPREVFESSSYVGQMRSSRIDGEKTVESIKNMLTSADESVDTARILKNLDAVRVTYLHKNKAGGSLYEEEQRILDYRRRLDKARDDATELEEQQRSLDKAKNDCATVSRELEDSDALLTQMNKIAVLQRFKELEKKKAECCELKDRREAHKSAELGTEFFPTHTHLAELDHAAKTFRAAQSKYLEQTATINAHGSQRCDSELVELGKRIEDQGGAEKIIATKTAKQKKRKAQNRVIVALWMAQAIFSASAVMLYLSGIFWGLGLLTFIILPIIFTVTCSLTKKKLSTQIADLAAEYGATPEELEQRLEEALRTLARSREQAVRQAHLNAALDNARQMLDSAAERLKVLLLKTCEDPTLTAEYADNERIRLERFMSKYEDFNRAIDTLERLIADEEAALRVYDREALAADISVDPAEITPMAISESERVRRSLVARKASLETRVINLTNSIATLRATMEDPLAVADALAELEEKNLANTDFYDALTLAMDSIEQASRVMSGSITPAISSRASELMAGISADKYKVLRTSGTLGVSLDSDGFGIRSDMLSEGTKDAAYLSLRIALFEHIYKDERSPLILDEALCQFDDIRAARMLSVLSGLSSTGVQCLCFTSHKREGQILDSAGIKYTDIRL